MVNIMSCTVAQLYALALSVLTKARTAALLSSVFGPQRPMGQATQPVVMSSQYALPSVLCLTAL